MEKVVRGSCLCGAVEYEVTGPFLFFRYCHCRRCRKATGSAHAANLMVKAAQFGWRKGEESVRRYELPEAEHYCTGFCGGCGSSLPWRSRNGRYVIVPAGSLDGDPGVRPDRNVFWASRATWLPPSSDLDVIDEGP